MPSETHRQTASIFTQNSSFVHAQPTPIVSWMVNHNLGYRPSVHIEDVTGQDVEGEVVHVDETTLSQALIDADHAIPYYGTGDVWREAQAWTGNAAT